MRPKKNRGHKQNSPHRLGTMKFLEVVLKDVFGILPRCSRADWLPMKAGQYKYCTLTLHSSFLSCLYTCKVRKFGDDNVEIDIFFGLLYEFNRRMNFEAPYIRFSSLKLIYLPV